MLLIVDDDPTFLEQAQNVLDVGRGVFFAGSAEHAKELIGTVGAEFAMVMIDLDLPGQDGFSLIRGDAEELPRSSRYCDQRSVPNARAGECEGYRRGRYTTEAY